MVRVISGVYEDTRGPAETFSPAHMLDLRLKPGAQVRLPTPRDYNTALLALDGQVTANGSKPVSAGEFILFKNDGDEVVVESLTESIVMFLSGAPIVVYPSTTPHMPTRARASRLGSGSTCGLESI